MRIFVDMDDVCVNLMEPWLAILNESASSPKQDSDVRQWDITKLYPDLTADQVFSPLKSERLWQNVIPIKDAYKYLKQLKSDGHEVYIATASMPHSYYLKTTHCLLKWFDFLTPKDVICINNKSLLMGDVLFDDYYENLRNFKGIRVLKDRPFNKDCDKSCYDFRISTWKMFYKVITELANVERDDNNE